MRLLQAMGYSMRLLLLVPICFATALVLINEPAPAAAARERAALFNRVALDEGDHMTKDTSENAGKKLRVGLEALYQQLANGKALKPRNDISQEVAKYIPPGTSFGDAKSILFAAGFDVRVPDDQTLSGLAKLPSSWFASVEVFVRISGKERNGPNNDVGSIEAVMTYSTL